MNADGTFARNETYLENGQAGSETATFTRIPLPTGNPGSARPSKLLR